MEETVSISNSYDQTTVHPVGLAVLLAMSVTMLLVPRRYAIWPMIVVACFIAPAQRVVVFGLDFNLLRIMVLFGCVRLALRNEWRSLRLRLVDYVIVAWAVSGTICYSLLHMTGGAVVFKLGTSYDAVGMYFLFRCLIRGWEDVLSVGRGFAVAAVPVLAAFCIEHSTGRNLFAALGGVPPITLVREGRLRCQGAFAHAILAGCFWAAVMPNVGILWLRRGADRLLAWIGIAASTAIIVLCASSTPILGVLVAIVGSAAFVIRRWMGWVVWGTFALLVCLHVVMDKPVWHLLGRVNVVGGSTGYHRYRLIDTAISRFDEWWLLGTVSTDHWGRQLFDITNQFILEGVRGGISTLIIFVVMIALSFRQVGRNWRAAPGDPEKQFFAWALGVSLMVHVTNFIGVSYFGQITMLWYLTLAMIQSVHPGRLARAAAAAAPAHNLRQGVRPRAAGESLVAGAADAEWLRCH
jgi:hypothetical protein